MAESDRVALYAADGAPRAAILLTGHVRTFDRTAPTLDEFLIKANPGYVFSLFCSTYREREAAVSISKRQQKNGTKVAQRGRALRGLRALRPARPLPRPTSPAVGRQIWVAVLQSIARRRQNAGRHQKV
jgi:hypothetical protein